MGSRRKQRKKRAKDVARKERRAQRLAEKPTNDLVRVVMGALRTDAETRHETELSATVAKLRNF